MQLVDDVVSLLLELAVLLIVIINQVELHVVQYQEHQLVNLIELGALLLIHIQVVIVDVELLELVVHLLIELLVQHMQTTLQHEVLVLQQHLLVVIEVGV